MQSPPASLGTTQREITARRPEASLIDTYQATSLAKAGIAGTQRAKAIEIYDAHQAGKRSEHLATPATPEAAAKQDAALGHYINAVNKALADNKIDRATNPDGFEAATRQAYRSMIEAHGVEEVKPTKRATAENAHTPENLKYEDWYPVYKQSFPIRGERETKKDMRELLSENMTDKGYGEFAIGLRDPLTGKYAGGVQGLVVSEAKGGIFTYAFLDPAYQGFGLSKTLIDNTKKKISDTAAIYNPSDKREPLVAFEKNDLSQMSLETIVLDTTGINVLRMPREGDAVGKGAISQSQRDGTWSHRGGKVVTNAGYIQPSLDGVTEIKNAKDEKLAIRYLQQDASLTEKQRGQAAKIISSALGGKAEHCPLELAVFAGKEQTSIDATQLKQLMKPFLQTSVLGVDSEAEMMKDVFVKATMGKLDKQTDAKGRLGVTDIKPYAGSIEVKNFAEAEQVFIAMLKVVPKAEVKANAQAAKRGEAEVSYGELLGKYETQIRAELGGKFAPAAQTEAATRPGAGGINPKSYEQRLAM